MIVEQNNSHDRLGTIRYHKKKNENVTATQNTPKLKIATISFKKERQRERVKIKFRIKKAVQNRKLPIKLFYLTTKI